MIVIRPVGQEEEEDDTDVPYDGSDPAYHGGPGTTNLTCAEREAAARFSRPAATAALDEPELEPLPAINKVATIGKAYNASQQHVFRPGFEGACVAVNPANDTIAVASRDNKLLLLDTSKLTVMSTVTLDSASDAAITAISFKPETKGSTQNVAYIAQNDQVVMLHTSTGKVLGRHQETNNKINCIAIRGRDGTALATAGSDTAVRIYDETAGGRLLVTLTHGDDVSTTGHSNSVYSVAWSPDDPQILCSGGWDQAVKVWDLRCQRAVRSIYGPYICGDSISVRNGRILTGSWRHSHVVQQWDLASGKLLTNMPFHQPEYEACMVYCAKYGEGRLDGLAFAGGGGKRPVVRIYKTAGELVGTLALPSACVGLAQLSAGPSEKQRSVVICCPDRLLKLDV